MKKPAIGHPMLLALALMGAMTVPGAITRADGPSTDCTCRYLGQDFHLGQVACIRGRLARCEKVANNTSWKFIATTCPLSRKVAPRPIKRFTGPDVTVQRARS